MAVNVSNTMSLDWMLEIAGLLAEVSVCLCVCFISHSFVSPCQRIVLLQNIAKDTVLSQSFFHYYCIMEQSLV